MKELRRIRRAKDITQEELGQRVGLSAAAISAFERGEANPKQDTLIGLADALDVAVDELLGRLPKKAEATPSTLPPDFDVVALTLEVRSEHPDVPPDSAEFRLLVDERFVSELGDLPKSQLEAIEADLLDKYSALDKSFHSPTWTDQERHADYLRLLDEIRAVKLTMDAVSRVKTAVA